MLFGGGAKKNYPEGPWASNLFKRIGWGPLPPADPVLKNLIDKNRAKLHYVALRGCPPPQTAYVALGPLGGFFLDLPYISALVPDMVTKAKCRVKSKKKGHPGAKLPRTRSGLEET